MAGDDFEFSPPTDLICSPEEHDLIEAKNSVRLFDKVVDLFDQSNGVLCITPDVIAELHRITMKSILGNAGCWRTRFVDIAGSSHVPPKHSQIPTLIQEMCDYANERQGPENCLNVAGFLLWRLNWIHPFTDGNGRVSRAICCLAYYVGFDIFPYDANIPELIDSDPKPYYAALADTDALVGGSETGIPDMRNMTDLMSDIHLKIMEQTLAQGQ